MKLLSLHDELQTNKDIRSIGNDFYALRITHLGIKNYPFQIGMYICCICLSGENRGRINLKPYTLKASGISINFPGQLLEQEFISEDFEALCIIMSKDFVSSLGLPYNFQRNITIQDNPIFALTEKQMDAMLSYYTAATNIIDEKHPNRIEVIRHLTCALFYNIGHHLHQASIKGIQTNEEIIMERFLKEVQQHYKEERKVLYYAEKLHLTPGYLSTIIKNFSGKTAAEWIDDYVILEARALLKSTNLTIQQISDDLNFPSQSFFGKYFKRVVGLSPKEYRET